MLQLHIRLGLLLTSIYFLFLHLIAIYCLVVLLINCFKCFELFVYIILCENYVSARLENNNFIFFALNLLNAKIFCISVNGICQNVLNCYYVMQDEPFTSHSSDGLFNIARYLLHCMMGEVPIGISKVYPLFPATNSQGLFSNESSWFICK